MRRRQRIVLGAAILSLVAVALAGYYHWDAFVLGLVAALLWMKKAMTLGSLMVLVKKLPFLLLAGGKKVVVKTLGGLMLFSARNRFRPVRKVMVNLKLSARFILRRVRYHWSDMPAWERTLVGLGAVPLILAATMLLIAVASVPKSLRSLLTRKVQESTAASVVTKVVPKKPREQVEVLHGRVKKKLKHWSKPKG